MTPDVQTWAQYQAFPFDVPEELARDLLLGEAVAAIHSRGFVPTGEHPVFERIGPIFPGATIYGCDEEGDWIGDPRDYALVVRVESTPPATRKD